MPPPGALNIGGHPVYRSLPRGSKMILDRLGCAGHCLNPSEQHHNLEVIGILRQAHRAELKLPVEGHDFNQCEFYSIQQ